MDKNEPTSTKTGLDLEEQQLKIEELRLKVKDLKRPDYLRPGFWTSIFAVLIAFGGILAQNVLSNIKSERANLDLQKALKEKETAESLAKKAKNDVDVAERRKKLADQDYATLEQQKDSAEITLTRIKQSIISLSASNAGSTSNRQQISQIQSLANQAQKELKFLPPRVYIQIANEQQRAAAQTLVAKLNLNKFVTPGIENVSGKASSPDQTQVRYYKDEDKPEAQKLIGILKTLNSGLPIKDTPIKINSTGTRPRHYEIWFAKV